MWIKLILKYFFNILLMYRRFEIVDSIITLTENINTWWCYSISGSSDLQV